MHPKSFTKLVHEALNRLYDSSYLHAHPLAGILLTLQQQASQPSQELRRIILHALRTLRPQPGTPAQSSEWRTYRILEMRYIEGLTAGQAMKCLHLGRSQFYRDQARMVTLLAQLLWTLRVSSPATAAVEADDDVSPEGLAAQPVTRGELAYTEVQRLTREAHWEQVDIVQMVDKVRSLLEPLAKGKGAVLRFDLTHAMCRLSVDRVMFRQALIAALTYAIDRIPQSDVTVCSFRTAEQFGLEITALGADEATAVDANRRQGVGLRVSQELMSAMHGVFEVVEDRAVTWQARMTWPSPARPVLLVVDDNTEFAHMCQRYLAAQDWTVEGVADAAHARMVLAAVRPAVILLDIMLPKEDGWELLAWLKSTPDLRDIPVILCSVLNEPDLAEMLGAAGYLTKPLSQSQLLESLQSVSRAHTSLASML